QWNVRSRRNSFGGSSVGSPGGGGCPMNQSSSYSCPPAQSVLRQGRIAELRKIHTPGVPLASHRERQNRANTVIVLCALAILTFVLGLLELRIRRLTAHSWSLSTAVQFSVAW